MKRWKIDRIAKKFIRELRGKVDFVSVEEKLKCRGYMVIFYNTPVGNRELERFGLMETASETLGFTYKGSANIIFIDGNCSSEEKLYLLYHETGHIILKHLNYPRFAIQNRVLLDIEADVFAHQLYSKECKF